MTIDRDAWLCETMGREAFRVGLISDECDTDRLARHVASQKSAFYFAKVDTGDVAAVRTLSRFGFTVVDVNMTFAAAPASVAGPTPDGIVVEPAAADTADAVLDIAGSSFRYSRFHLDPAIERTTADAVKREWIRSYLDGRRGDRLFVASAGGRPVGFLAALTSTWRGEAVAVIDLIGVAAACQRRGIGRALVRSFAAHYASQPCVIVGTQAANIPSIRLYESCGFRLAASAYVMHLHVGAR